MFALFLYGFLLGYYNVIKQQFLAEYRWDYIVMQMRKVNCEMGYKACNVTVVYAL